MSIKIKNLTHVYMEGTPFERKALDKVNIEINAGEFVTVIGHTGSGKSTLIQHINALLKPNSGTIIIDGINPWDKNVKLAELRKRVGLVFQYPEYQLFEDTIEKDIAYGPRNLNLSEEEIKNRVIRAMNTVGLDYEKYKDKSPFDLSGGQKRRVAIAGVVAMEPKILILDEPTAGLDPKGRDEILFQIRELHNKYEMTTILVSHSMEDVAKISDRIFVMNKGTCVLEGTSAEVFKQTKLLESIGLAVPQIKYLQLALREKGFDISDDVFTVEQAKNEIIRLLRGSKDDK